MCGVTDDHEVSASARQRQALAAEAPPTIAETDSDNCFRILIATDNHIGYAEKDPVRGQDAINSFREILEIAREEQVDFILLGGDLFHENRPSRTSMHQTIALLREYTLGDKPVSFELLSDPMDGSAPGFTFPAVNYEDPNLNVAIPVFSIHGNHDDPQGAGPEGALCALDVLSVTGLLNYFGKLDLAADEGEERTNEGIKIRPILLRKGDTHLALYGVGNVKDARMHYELRSNRVKMYMPSSDFIAQDDCVKHGPQQYVPEGMFDDSIKLVLWGHEHDCRITPEAVEGKPYHITQPGSSVATSLAWGESLPKKVGILSVQGDQFQIAEIPLKTVRPFELEEIVLAEEAARPENKINLEERDTITAFLREKVDELILQARRNWRETHDPKTEQMMLPLIRLRVETTGAKEMTNVVRFGQDFVDRVANPRDILQYHRKKKTDRKPANRPDLPEEIEEEEEDAAGMTTSDRLAKTRMATLVHQYLQAQNLEVLVEAGLEDAVMRFVDKDDKDAIKDFVADTLKQVDRSMRAKKDLGEDNVEEHMLEAKEAAAANWEEHGPQREKAPKSKKKRSPQSDESMDSMMEDDDDFVPKPKATTSRTARGKSKQALFTPASDHDSEESEVEEIEEMPPPKTTARTAAKRTTTATRGTTRGTRTTTTTRGRAAAKPAATSRSRGPQQSQLSFTKTTRGAAKLVGSDSD